MSFLQGLLGPPDVEKMNMRKLWKLMAALGLAVTSLLLLFLLLGQITVGAAPGENVTITDAQPFNASFTVSGTVTCEGIGPISGVKVFAWNRDKGSGSVDDTTDSSGTYSMTLEAGNYDLIFNPACGSGCASQSLKGIAGPPDQTRNVTLSPGHSVSGMVTDGINPLKDVSIYAFHQDTADGFGLPLTDENGHYCIGLITGTYDLGFSPPACQGLGPKTVGTTVNQAMSLNVTLPPGFTVAGRVTNEADDPVSGVQIYARECDTCTGYGFSPSNVNGYYTGTLPTGTYDIQFIPPAGRGLGSVTVVDVVNETGGCPNTWRPITLPTGFTVSGKVTCNGKPVKNVFVYADPVGGGAPGDDLVGWGVYSVDDGSYGLPLIPGTYSLEFIPPPATGINAKAFTTIELTTDTVLNMDFCLCSGVWVSETVDSAGDVGKYTSLALAATYPYTPHISYHNNAVITGDLKHAWLSGTTWLSETVDPVADAGNKTSLALVPTYPYTPCISYSDRAGGDWGIRFACRDSTSWSITVVYPPGHWAGQNGTSLAMEPTYPYTPHISYYVPFGAYNLRHAYLSGTAWMSGTWVHEIVDDSQDGGTDSSIALEPTSPYTPHISYRMGGLKHAWLSGTTWLSETVDSWGDVGYHTSLALDSSGNPHISYFDDTNNALKYARLSGTTWLSETVDSIGEPPYGSGTSLELDQADAPYISYYDAISDDLKLAYFNGTAWIIQTVDSEGDVGSWSSLALDQAGCPHISYYDATKGDLKYAHIPPTTEIRPPDLHFPIIMKNYLQP
jgi:hypothetical protein